MVHFLSQRAYILETR